MSREFLDFVEDILDGMNKAEILLEGVSYSQFETDLWKGMAGMRDRIIHGYDNVDLQIVWDVVKRDIPQLKPKIELLLQDYKG
jgi:uncharacterized protein with HEPN domain